MSLKLLPIVFALSMPLCFVNASIKSQKFQMKDRSESIAQRWKSSQSWMRAQSSVNLEWSENVIETGDWIIKSALVSKVCKIKTNEAQEVLLQLLSDKGLVVRSSAVDCLAQRMNPVVREGLWSALQDPINKRGEASLWIREQILEILLAQPSASDRLRLTKMKEVEREKKITALIDQAIVSLSR